MGVGFVFTDRHAYLEAAEPFSNLANLDRIDWTILQNRNFSRDLNDPGKIERYQAEALVHSHLPVNALLGLACYNDTIKKRLDNLTEEHKLELKVTDQPGWYFQ